MHESGRWVVGVMGALVLSLLAGSASAGPPPASAPLPVVVQAGVDRLEPDRLVIHGIHFGGTSPPVVLLARVPLEVLSFSDEQIVAKLPIDAPAAIYRLPVLAYGTVPSRFFEVTLGRRPG